MPYVRCQHCGLTSFSVAQWSSIDHCSGCHAELPRSAPGARRRPRPDVGSEVRERLYTAPGRRTAVDRIDRAAARRG
jgi:hypothetical protein